MAIRRVCAAAVLLSAASACSSPREAAPPVTADEQRALAEARAMIPADELPSATPTAAAQEGARR